MDALFFRWLIRGCLARWSGAVLLLKLLPVSLAVHAAKGWETTEWAVICSSELIRTMPSDVCDDTVATGPASATRAVLEEASAWLKGLGFRGPNVETLGGKGSPYKAYISDAKNIDEHGHASYGVRNGYERTRFMSSDLYFVVGEGDTAEQRRQNFALDLPA